MIPARPTAGSAFEWLTGAGPAAIAIVRAAGPGVSGFLRRHVRTRQPTAAPGDVYRARLIDADGETLDDVLVSVHGVPPTWDVRLHLHGSPWLVARCSELLRGCGLREQEPAGGLWAAADVLEAECHAGLPRMRSLRGARWLLAQPARLRSALAKLAESSATEEDRATCTALAEREAVFEWFSRPARVALVGPPNAGKSTLLNALAEQPVSLTSPAPGTTRDWVDVAAIVRGFPVVWLDTAGLRAEASGLEAVGAARTRELLAHADAVVVVLDATATPVATEERAAFVESHGWLAPAAVVLNKQDLAPEHPEPPELPGTWRAVAVWVSATQRTGLEALLAVLLRSLGRDERLLEGPGAFTERQAALLRAAAAASGRRAYRELLDRCRGVAAPEDCAADQP